MLFNTGSFGRPAGGGGPAAGPDFRGRLFCPHALSCGLFVAVARVKVAGTPRAEGSVGDVSSSEGFGSTPGIPGRCAC